MTLFRSILLLRLADLAVLCLVVPVSIRAAEPPTLRIVFGPRSTLISGAATTEATAEALVAVVKSARPDLIPDRSGLTIDPSVTLPDIADLRSLLSEVGLSTHEGRMELWPDRLAIGGLTDSLVTQTALRIRAEPLLAGRIFVNRLCIVGTDDLPKIAVSLSGGEAVAMEVTPVPVATPESTFEVPGLLLAKLLPTIRLLGNLDRLSGGGPATIPASQPVRAQPIEMTATSANANPAMGAGANPPITPLTATPVETFESLPSVLFSRSSFLLQVNQNESLDKIARHLLTPGRRGAPVRVEAIQPSGGSVAFNDYLCERRGAEVIRLLTERGVEESLFSTKTVTSNSPIDGGEVRLLVEVLPPPDLNQPAPPLPVGSTTTASPGQSPSPTTAPVGAAPVNEVP